MLRLNNLNLNQEQRLKQQQIFLDFLEKIQQANSLDDCWQVYQQEMASYGISEILYGLQVGDSGTRQHHDINCFISSYNHDFMKVYQQSDYIENDYTFQWCQQNKSIYYWNYFETVQVIESLTQKQIKVEELSRDFNILNGLSIPLRLNHSKSWGGVGLSATGIKADEFDLIYSEYGELIYALTLLFHQTVQKFPFILKQKGKYDQIINLTGQEIQSLLLISCGDQVMKIADTMHKSKRTIEIYLQCARKKLNAKTNAHAVSIALQLGYLS